jgi:5-methylthioadenosine/S-adenosylhomocysteine deaminase
VWLSDRDVRTIAESGAVPVHNPAANMRLGSGFSPVRRFIDTGCLPALGADGCMSGDHQNMFAIVHLAAMIHNSFDDGFDTARWISSREAFSMATVGGARALRMESRLGAIEAGRLADIALLDLNSPALCPLNDACHAMAYTVPSSAVRHVIVGGRVVVRGGLLTTIDENALYAECRESAARHAFDGDLPGNVAEEIARVLRDRNKLYAETSFPRR